MGRTCPNPNSSSFALASSSIYVSPFPAYLQDRRHCSSLNALSHPARVSVQTSFEFLPHENCHFWIYSLNGELWTRQTKHYTRNHPLRRLSSYLQFGIPKQTVSRQRPTIVCLIMPMDENEMEDHCSHEKKQKDCDVSDHGSSNHKFAQKLYSCQLCANAD